MTRQVEPTDRDREEARRLVTDCAAVLCVSDDAFVAVIAQALADREAKARAEGAAEERAGLAEHCAGLLALIPKDATSNSWKLGAQWVLDRIRSRGPAPERPCVQHEGAGVTEPWELGPCTCAKHAPVDPVRDAARKVVEEWDAPDVDDSRDLQRAVSALRDALEKSRWVTA